MPGSKMEPAVLSAEERSVMAGWGRLDDVANWRCGRALCCGAPGAARWVRSPTRRRVSRNTVSK
jgi:hypothetical protein